MQRKTLTILSSVPVYCKTVITGYRSTVTKDCGLIKVITATRNPCFVAYSTVINEGHLNIFSYRKQKYFVGVFTVKSRERAK